MKINNSQDIIVFKYNDGAYKKYECPSLIVDIKNRTFQYAFNKQKTKTMREMVLDLLSGSGKEFMRPIITTVTVFGGLDDILHIDYQPWAKDMILTGSFTVKYDTPYFNQSHESFYNYPGSCFSLNCDFDSPEKFINIFDCKGAKKTSTLAPFLVNL